MTPEIRHCGDIGLFAIDRPRGSCSHATEYCRAHCYNRSIERRFPACKPKDRRNERAWQSCSGADYAAALDRKQLPTKRLRLMTRGEAFETVADVERVRDIVAANPDRMIWIPTRGWRDPTIRRLIESYVMALPNVIVQASLDPSNTKREYRNLRSAHWSTIYFGDGSGWRGPTGEDTVKCPKTYRKFKGAKACQTCKAGCFAPILRNRRVDVLLKEH